MSAPHDTQAQDILAAELFWQTVSKHEYLQAQGQRIQSLLHEHGLAVWQGDSQGLYRLCSDGSREDFPEFSERSSQ